jgi:hypothetical protein
VRSENRFLENLLRLHPIEVSLGGSDRCEKRGQQRPVARGFHLIANRNCFGMCGAIVTEFFQRIHVVDDAPQFADGPRGVFVPGKRNRGPKRGYVATPVDLRQVCDCRQRMAGG